MLRDPTLTLTNGQLPSSRRSEWFEDGQLGMIAGFRDLTPSCGTSPGLNFDVMPMPELDDDATVGDLTGLCVAEGPQERVEQSADFLVHLLSDESVDDDGGDRLPDADQARRSLAPTPSCSRTSSPPTPARSSTACARSCCRR